MPQSLEIAVHAGDNFVNGDYNAPAVRYSPSALLPVELRPVTLKPPFCGGFSFSAEANGPVSRFEASHTQPDTALTVDFKHLNFDDVTLGQLVADLLDALVGNL